MSIRRRYLVREATGRLVELSSRRFDGADDGTAPIRAYAGRCVDLVSAVIVDGRDSGARDGAPRLTELAFTKLYFDSSGFVDAGMRDRMIRLLLESCADVRRREDVGGDDVRRAGAARRQLAHEFAWTPAPAEVGEVMVRLDEAAPVRPPSATVH